jgi:hypothetical protein
MIKTCSLVMAAGGASSQAMNLNVERVIPVPSPNRFWYLDSGASKYDGVP